MPLDPGTLNKRITMSAPSTTQDEYGQPTNIWTPIRTCWAGIRTASSREVYAASGFVSQLSHVITVRYVADQPPKAGMQVGYKDRTFRVQAVSDPDESQERVELLCLEQ